MHWEKGVVVYFLCCCSKVVLFWCKSGFHHKVCKREGMYRRLEGNDCGNKEKENQCLGVDGWILSFMYVRNLLYENRALWCLPMMWAVLFLIIPNVGSFISQF